MEVPTSSLLADMLSSVKSACVALHDRVHPRVQECVTSARRLLAQVDTTAMKAHVASMRTGNPRASLRKNAKAISAWCSRHRAATVAIVIVLALLLPGSPIRAGGAVRFEPFRELRLFPTMNERTIQRAYHYIAVGANPRFAGRPGATTDREFLGAVFAYERLHDNGRAQRCYACTAATPPDPEQNIYCGELPRGCLATLVVDTIRFNAFLVHARIPGPQWAIIAIYCACCLLAAVATHQEACLGAARRAQRNAAAWCVEALRVAEFVKAEVVAASVQAACGFDIAEEDPFLEGCERAPAHAESEGEGDGDWAFIAKPAEHEGAKGAAQ
mmetsp:Transcript_4879/g.16266  ORF Transcript_4879/g.16266 Transcript_4879/m.16266 type:complete len:329 (-) Transcript_4879:303-1289(-)